VSLLDRILLTAVVDLGCVFIGHGLAKDFRTISELDTIGQTRCCSLTNLDIYVPPAQVLDTVNLYTSEDHKRKLSLRFLSWFLLKKDIQTSSHDSIEDARYALLLYKLWTEFKRDDRLSDVMDDIFFEGHKLVSTPSQGRMGMEAEELRVSNHPSIVTASLHQRHLQLQRHEGCPGSLERLRPPEQVGQVADVESRYRRSACIRALLSGRVIGDPTR
jgi:hypothetical protein